MIADEEMERAPNHKRPRRRRRRDCGFAVTAGVPRGPREERLSATLRLLRAALDLWEKKQEYRRVVSVWKRREQSAVEAAKGFVLKNE